MKPKPNTGGKFTPAPAGTHFARLIRILHVGTIITDYQGSKKKSDKVLLTFELTNEKFVFDEAKGEQPFLISREDTFSYGDRANLPKLVEGILGRKLTDDEKNGDFEIDTLIGMPCLLNVVQKETKNGRIVSNIVSASPLIKGMEAPAAINKTVVFDYDHFDQKYFDSLPEYLRKKMETSDEYRTMKGLAIVELPEEADLDTIDYSANEGDAVAERGEDKKDDASTSEDIPF